MGLRYWDHTVNCHQLLQTPLHSLRTALPYPTRLLLLLHLMPLLRHFGLSPPWLARPGMRRRRLWWVERVSGKRVSDSSPGKTLPAPCNCHVTLKKHGTSTLPAMDQAHEASKSRGMKGCRARRVTATTTPIPDAHTCDLISSARCRGARAPGTAPDDMFRNKKK